MRSVSLVILNRNGLHFLGPCLDSIRRQTRTPDEIIVVDNGSTDGSQEWLSQHHPDIALLDLGYNTGFSLAMNRAIAAATGDYIALLNNDTECEPQWLSELIEALDRHPDVGFCASKMLHYQERYVIDTAGDGLTKAGQTYKRGFLHTDDGQYDRPERVFGACAGAALYRKQMLDEIGGFDEDFYIFQEDGDLNFRAQLAGYPCLFVPSAIVYHHVGGTWKKTGYEFSIRLGQRNLIFVLIKNLPTVLWIRYGIWIIMNNIYSLLLGIWGGYGMAVLKGRFDVLRGLRLMLRKRHDIQRNRRVSNDYLISILNHHWVHQMVESVRQKRVLRRQGINIQ